jgi:hypothetical protein
MGRMIPSGRKVAAALVAVGALSMGAAGAAGAATSSPAPTVHIDCARATKVLTRIERVEARISAGLPRLTAAEHRATANGHPLRAHHIGRLIARLESSRAHTRLTRRSATIEAACHVSAPAIGPVS